MIYDLCNWIVVVIEGEDDEVNVEGNENVEEVDSTTEETTEGTTEKTTDVSSEEINLEIREDPPVDPLDFI